MKTFFFTLLFLAFTTAHSPAETPPATVQTHVFGKLRDGREIKIFTLDNANGLQVKVCELGATIVSIVTPDKHGAAGDIVLGYDDLSGYENDYSALGTVMGRYANRIAGAKFSLDGTVYSLPANNAPGGLPCCLHGGKNGFNKKVWSGTVVAGGVLLRLRSADGEEGFPGAVDVSVLYEVLPANTLRITYGATTNRPTPLNLTQHSYFNLAGGTGDILSHSLKLGATHYTPFNKGLIPTGEIAPVAGTPLDFTTPHRIGERINSAHPQMRLAGGYDHNWVLTSTAGNAAGSTAGSAGTLRFAAELHDSQSGRTMRVFTTEPGIQIYTGNGLAGVCGKNKQTYSKHAGIALETQHFPDSPNQPAFPNTILRPSERFHSVTELRFF